MTTTWTSSATSASSPTFFAATSRGIVFGRPSADEEAALQGMLEADGDLPETLTFVETKDVFRILAKSDSSVLEFSYRQDGVHLGRFLFPSSDERNEAVGVIADTLGMHATTQESASGGFADAVKPGLYLLVVVMITFGLSGALAEGASTVDATGVTAAKAGALIAIAEKLGPTGVWVAGGILGAFFLVRTILALRSGGDVTVLEPVKA